jgi:hypothetical protein
VVVVILEVKEEGQWEKGKRGKGKKKGDCGMIL